MNITKKFNALLAALLIFAGPAFGATYSDATNDLLPATAGAQHLNISSLEITNDATTISFRFNLVGNPTGDNFWGEYQIGINSIPGSGATNFVVPVPNGRPITMSVGGMDYWIRSWDSGAETYHWDNGGSYWYGDYRTWDPPSDIQFPVKTTNSVTLTTTLTSLGLHVGDSFYFDAYTSGATATDSAVDALANPNPTVASGDWVTPYDSATNVYQYTVTGSAPMLTNAFGAAYSDAIGDLLPATIGNPHLDIAAVDITNDANNISFKIYLAGDPTGANNWGEYNIGINSIVGGATSGTVPPTRPITMSVGGMDYWIRSWDTGAESYHWDGAAWFGDNFTWGNNPGNLQVPVKTTNSVTLTTTLASLGLSAGSSFYFDVYTSGGTGSDSAVDALANPNPTAASGDWVTPYDSGARVFQYTVSGGVVPTPPELNNPHYTGTTFTVGVPTQSGFNFILEFKNSLTDASWTAVQTNAGTGATITMTNSAVTAPNRFYRVRVQ